MPTQVPNQLYTQCSPQVSTLAKSNDASGTMYAPRTVCARHQLLLFDEPVHLCLKPVQMCPQSKVTLLPVAVPESIFILGLKSPLPRPPPRPPLSPPRPPLKPPPRPPVHKLHMSDMSRLVVVYTCVHLLSDDKTTTPVNQTLLQLSRQLYNTSPLLLEVSSVQQCSYGRCCNSAMTAPALSSNHVRCKF